MLEKLLGRLGTSPSHRLRVAHVVNIGAALTLFWGAAIVIGWVAACPQLGRPYGSTAYVDSVLFCIVAAGALLAAVREKYAASRIIGGVLAIGANLHFTANLAGVTISVQKLLPNLAASVLPAAVAEQVQLASVTAVAFFLCGCALALMSPHRSAQTLALKAAMGVVVALIGAILLCSPGAIGRTAPAMDQWTAACILVLGMSLCALCWMHAGAVSDNLSGFSIAIGAIGLVLILGGVDTTALVKIRAALLYGSDIGEIARLVVLKNLINLVLTSYVIAVFLVAATLLLARFETRRASIRAAGVDTREPTKEPNVENNSEATRNQKHVLLIEDNEDVMALVGHAFHTHGNGQYKLTWANCLKGGFHELMRGAVDIVLLDLGLPESTGGITYACVRGCAPQVPILVMTGDDQPEVEESVVAAGVDRFLLKQQISGAMLVQAVESVLHSKERPPQMNLHTPIV